jgi:hypothetical protein
LGCRQCKEDTGFLKKGAFEDVRSARVIGQTSTHICYRELSSILIVLMAPLILTAQGQGNQWFSSTGQAYCRFSTHRHAGAQKERVDGFTNFRISIRKV